ncbi:radical SAM protein [Pantanalinema sp. GBBB05]|uniref:radical SAM protein n=1 Tax=Pantanalinema sp. GBBB05 TaxID=2604139 RepID=UPI001D4D0B43|nr:radical SAM protein [Pantanalinema sp. GBBB05]
MVNPPLPSYVQIEPVGQCNLRCRMCSIQFRDDAPVDGSPAFMAFATFTQLIDQFTTLKNLHLQGLGEPMMHPRFFDMVEYAVQKGIQVTTNSNLTLLGDKQAERCVTSGLHSLHVSIDGATPTTYERIRVGSSFDRVIGNLNRLQFMRRHKQSKSPHLQLTMVLMRQNLHELPDLVRLAHQYAVDSLFVQHLCHDFGESTLPAHYQAMQHFVQAETLLEADMQHVESIFAHARSLAQALNVDLRLPRLRPKLHAPETPGRERCDWPWQGAYISYQGLAMPCCMISTPDRLNFGNVLQQGVEDTWQGEGYQAFRQQLNSATPPEVCRSCSIYSGTF